MQKKVKNPYIFHKIFGIYLCKLPPPKKGHFHPLMLDFPVETLYTYTKAMCLFLSRYERTKTIQMVQAVL